MESAKVVFGKIRFIGFDVTGFDNLNPGGLDIKIKEFFIKQLNVNESDEIVYEIGCLGVY
jgi:hypothetical protein